MIPNEKFYAVKEVAGILGVSRDTVVRLIKNGEMKAVKLPKCGGRGLNTTYRIPSSSVLRLIG